MTEGPRRQSATGLALSVNDTQSWQKSPITRHNPLYDWPKGDGLGGVSGVHLGSR